MPREDVILWLDLETTGSSSYSDILEIGMALTNSAPTLDLISTFERVIRPRDPNKLLTMEPDVVDMHMKSGLLAEQLAKKTLNLYATETYIDQWLNEHVGRSGEHIPLAGSGVSHFDRQFVRRDFPHLDKRLTYWAYDVGVLRRMLRLAGKTFEVGDRTHIQHRALADVLDHIEEARIYLKWLKEQA